MNAKLAEQTLTAHHEAGHAIVAVALGRGADRASVRPGDDGDLGRLILARLDHMNAVLASKFEDLTPRKRDLVERDPTVVFAGAATGNIHQGRESRFGSTDDWDTARKWCVGMSARDEEGDAPAKWLQAWGRSALLMHWGAVIALATALLERQDVGPRTVRDIFADYIWEAKEGAFDAPVAEPSRTL